MYDVVAVVVLLSKGGVTEIPEVRSLVKLQKVPFYCLIKIDGKHSQGKMGKLFSLKCIDLNDKMKIF